MNKFDLEKALAGEKVITRDGDEVTQLKSFDAESTDFTVYGVVNDEIECWTNPGGFCSDGSDIHPHDLSMAPKKLSGFVNIYSNSVNTFHASLKNANQYTENMPKMDRIACIDLSQFDEGHGL